MLRITHFGDRGKKVRTALCNHHAQDTRGPNSYAITMWFISA